MTGWSISFAVWSRIGRHEKVSYLRRKVRAEKRKADGRKGAIPNKQIPNNWARAAQDDNSKTYVSIHNFCLKSSVFPPCC
jgi:hypothetical protein